MSLFSRLFGGKKPRNKFSLDNLKHLYQELLQHPVVQKDNEKKVVEILRNIAEVVR